MSEIVRLPAVLPGEFDLPALNERLRSREAALDWSDVRMAPATALKELLQGLDLSDSADALGLGTIPEALIASVEAFFTGRPVPAVQPAGGPGGGVPPETPAVWSGTESDEPPVPPTVDSPPRPPAASAPAKILRKLSGLEIRSELEKKVFLDLHGPAGGPAEELVEPTVRDRYILGTLAPSGVELAAEEQDGISGAANGDDEDGHPDQDGGGRATLLPSSLGLTFRLEGRVDSVQVAARWGRYVRQRSESQIDERTGQGPLVWKRMPVEATNRVVLREGALELWSPFDQTPDVQVRGRARRSDGDWVVSLFLVNGQPAPPRGSREGQDSAWLFQAEMDVTAVDGAAVFLRRQGTHAGAFQAEIHTLDERIIDMLYRDVVEFAVGHGVGVHAAVSADPSRAVRLYTRAVPRFEVGRTTPPTPDEIPALSAVERDMKLLSTLSETEIVPKLLPLAEAYASWIALRGADIDRPDTLLEGRREEALAALERCREAEQRIRAGIDLLSHDPHAADAFRFLNRAMWLQRVRTKLTERVRRGDDVVFEEIDIPENRSWFPFQLAFILVCLPGITGLDHLDRGSDSEALADLLWFPTGGGKTEAYLGLSAYVMALRRLQGPIGGRSGEYGVAVLMRYTLRLLTLQQFQRASALLCACESIRLENPKKWGSNPFRIGLWVGKRVTPNTTEQSSDAIRRAHGDAGWGTASRSGSPYQLVYCPWCGQKIDPGRDIIVESVSGGRGRTLQYCGDQLGRCLFSRANSNGEGLPIVVVDEEIYRLLPALVIATVDKFAQMPWNGPVEMLFGQMNGRCDRHGFRSPDLDDRDSHRPTRTGLPAAQTRPFLPVRPPDLIIQDELHLISGPLGTLVGLYETAVDRLCSWEVAGKVVRPKVIASTATIRRAGDQTHALFRRQVRVFPPPVLDYRDSFFARQRSPSEEHPGRLYVGVCAQGRRMKATLIRTYTALMSAAQALYEECGAAADPWMTNVGYFNSMRELGGMRRLIDDDIASRLKKMNRRGLAVRFIQPTAVEELTSRKASTDIPAILDRLDVSFDPQQTGGRRPLDVVLATNMVSVGVDVQRLGLMAVCGQPKTTAEYIQATSRVGRRHPGLVVTVYNWARPRDLSHYERFEHYHATFYTRVEALSVTPFASRALDRGLFAVLASLVRLGGLEFNANDRAGAVRRQHAQVAQAIDAIVERAHSVTHDRESADDVRRFLIARMDLWESIAASASGARPLGYKDSANTTGLLRYPSQESWGEFTCLMSLRDVEPEVDLILQEATGVDQVREFAPRDTGPAVAETEE